MNEIPVEIVEMLLFSLCTSSLDADCIGTLEHVACILSIADSNSIFVQKDFFSQILNDSQSCSISLLTINRVFWNDTKKNISECSSKGSLLDIQNN